MTAGALTICGGKYAGHQLQSPDRQTVRPMRSRVRGAVFDQLTDELQGSRFLDCFAGTGAIGLEALSRGAEFALFFDAADQAVSCIKQNIESVNETSRTRVQQCDVLDQRGVLTARERFDIISVTPPYPFYEQPDTRQKLFELLDHLAEAFLSPGGQMLVECEDHTRFGQPPSGLERIEERAFGTTVIHRFRTT
jgi:16S rRNA (guanine966-N2)-methyltransferase